MEVMTFSTPAILFSTVSLMFIAFTNRYIAISGLVRDLHTEYGRGKRKNDTNTIIDQIENLRVRLKLIQTMQLVSIISLLFSSASMAYLFFNYQITAKTLFGLGLAAQFIALCLSAYEVTLSTKALNLELSDMELKELSINPLTNLPNPLSQLPKIIQFGDDPKDNA
jgi:hypothetical protein